MEAELDILKAAREVFSIEGQALEKTAQALDDNFVKIVNLIQDCKGKVVLTGMGKPGHIATKIAATLSSLGTPSFFMHPAEALCGDLGMVEKMDIVILISYSGESIEVTRMLPVLEEIGCTTIAVTGKEKSTLAKHCLYRFILPEFEEACYMHLAPTSSTTALLVLGDALAVVTSRLRNYTKEDFGLYHPAGVLGKKLLVKVENLMYTGSSNAIIMEGSSLKQAIVEMSSKGLSVVTVVDHSMRLKGIITDGDLRRMLERGVDVYNEVIDNVMTKTPKWIDYREMAVNALQKMNEMHITSMPVLDENGLVVGSILLQDIINAGIVR